MDVRTTRQRRRRAVAAWTEMLADAGTITMTTRYAIELDDLALLSNSWSMDLGSMQLGAITSEVARRQPDGHWLYIFDNPDGAGMLE